MCGPKHTRKNFFILAYHGKLSITPPNFDPICIHPNWIASDDFFYKS